MEVITDYFTSTDESRDSDSDEDDVPDDGQAQLQGRARINTKHDTIIMMTMHNDDNDEADREKGYTAFMHQGKPICQKTFLFFHDIGVKHLNNLAASFKCTELQPHAHGNASRLPHNALSFSSMQFFVRFTLNYTEQHALLLPGRVPEYHRSDLQLLPSSVCK